MAAMQLLRQVDVVPVRTTSPPRVGASFGLVSSPSLTAMQQGDIREDVVFALRANKLLDIIDEGAHSVRSNPVHIMTTSGKWSTLP